MDLALESAFNPSSPALSRAATPRPAKSETVPGPSDSSASQANILPDGSEETVANSGNISNDTPASKNAATLEEEVGQVVHQLSSWGGSLWGGFRKQSAFAFDSVKKDLSRTVQEAQDDLKKLQTQTVEVEFRDPANAVDETTSYNGKGKGKERADVGEGSDPSTHAIVPLPSIHVPTTQETKDFFAKIGQTFSTQSTTLNQNLATLQKSLSESLAVASSNPQIQSLSLNKLTRSDVNFAQFTANIQKNLAQAGTKLNLQQAEKLAEEYFKKSEGLLHDAGEFLKDAVKVVPPEDSEGQAIAWDGSDMYSFSTADQSSNTIFGHTIFDSGRSTSTEISRSQLRKEALLHRLRADKELFLVNPFAETESESRREAFARFLQEQTEKNGRFEGESLDNMIEAELGPEGRDVETLKRTRDELVPSHLAKNVFWTRYFFHKFAIEDEERKRQELLQGKLNSPQEEEFSWDAEDESPQSAEDPVAKGASVPSSPSRTSDDVKSSSAITKPVDLDSTRMVPSVGNTDSSTNSARISEDSYVAISARKSTQADNHKKLDDDSRPEILSKQEADDDDDSDWE